MSNLFEETFLDLQPFGFDDMINSSVLTEDMEIDQFDNISVENQETDETSADVANTTIENFLADTNFGIRMTEIPAEATISDVISAYGVGETLDAGEDVMPSYEIAETFVAEIVSFTELSNNQIISMYYYDADTQTLKLDQNIKIETLPADAENVAEIVAETCMEVAEVITVPNNPYYCTECDKHFCKSGSFIQHRNAQHSGSCKKCQLCGKKFASDEALAKHAKNHDAASKTFKCEICPKSYNYKIDLKRHLVTHEAKAKKPFQCSYCEKGFIRNDHFLKHQKTLKCKKNSEKLVSKNVKKV